MVTGVNLTDFKMGMTICTLVMKRKYYSEKLRIWVRL